MWRYAELTKNLVLWLFLSSASLLGESVTDTSGPQFPELWEMDALYCVPFRHSGTDGLEAILKVTGLGSPLGAREMGCRGRGILEFKGQLGAEHRPGGDPEVNLAPGTLGRPLHPWLMFFAGGGRLFLIPTLPQHRKVSVKTFIY